MKMAIENPRHMGRSYWENGPIGFYITQEWIFQQAMFAYQRVITPENSNILQIHKAGALFGSSLGPSMS